MPQKNVFFFLTHRLLSDAQRMPQRVSIPAHLKHIIQSEGKSKDIKACLENIETAKQNELKAYLSLCHVRLGLPA